MSPGTPGLEDSLEPTPRWDSWAVTVERNGEQVVTIASNMLAGRDLSPEDEDTIRLAAQHLLSFVGNTHDCLECGTSRKRCDQWKAQGRIACCPECKHLQTP